MTHTIGDFEIDFELEPPEREHPLPGNLLQSVGTFQLGYDSATEESRYFTDDLDNAAVVTSIVQDDDAAVVGLAAHLTHGRVTHRPVIDVDLPIKVIPSSTEGHFHLYVDKPMTWEHYRHLLEALVTVGLVDEGYVAAAERRGYTAVRLPWISKSDTPRTAGRGIATADDPRCFRCNRSAVACYPLWAIDEAGSPAQMAQSDGTYNPETFHFCCDRCYIEIGQPSSPTGWRAP